MTVKMNRGFINYSNFLDILIEAYTTAHRELFEKMVDMIIYSLNEQKVKLEKEALEIDEMSLIPVDDLEEYYDTTLDEIEDIKLLKKRLIELKNKDFLFEKLYDSLDKLHQAFILHMDRMGELEIRIIMQESA
jgi:hypothetical protein